MQFFDKYKWTILYTSYSGIGTLMNTSLQDTYGLPLGIVNSRKYNKVIDRYNGDHRFKLLWLHSELANCIPKWKCFILFFPIWIIRKVLCKRWHLCWPLEDWLALEKWQWREGILFIMNKDTTEKAQSRYRDSEKTRWPERWG